MFSQRKNGIQMMTSCLIVSAHIVLFLLFCSVATTARADTVFFTGADLYNNPNVVLQSNITSLSGSSIAFGPIDATVNEFVKLVSLPLISLGEWDDIGEAIVTVSLNLTRLPRLPAGAEDHDTVIALGNGTQIVGSEIADNDYGSAFLDEFADMGTYGDRVAHQIIFQSAGFPEIGGSYNVDLTFTLNAGSTLVNVSFLNGSGSAAGSLLGRPADLHFLFMSDNDQGEQYQLNTLSITSNSLSVIPEPSTIILLAIGLAGVGIVRKRFKNP